MYHEWTDEFGDRYAVGSGYVFHQNFRNPITVGRSKKNGLPFLRFSVCVGCHKEKDGGTSYKYANVSIYGAEINRSIFALAKTLRHRERVFFWGPVYSFQNQEGVICKDVSAEGFFPSDRLSEIISGEKAPSLKDKANGELPCDAVYDKMYPF